MGERPSEFEIIERYFSLGVPSAWPSQGIGDDCAFLDIGATRVAVTTDTSAIGTHYLPDADPWTVGYKALAVNLSDLAAAGSTPRAFFLALSLPQSDPDWLERFSAGLKLAASRYHCALLGGDTTKTVRIGDQCAPAVITITALGEVKKGLTRGGARPGDDIWVSGTIGDAYAALMFRTGQWAGTCPAELARHMDCPTPRVELGEFLEPLASACADISDGLLQDLGHILKRSGVGARLYPEALAVSDALAQVPHERRLQAQLAGGDDYELVFTAPEALRPDIVAYAVRSRLSLSRIGKIVSEKNLLVCKPDGTPIPCRFAGFDHFR